MSRKKGTTPGPGFSLVDGKHTSDGTFAAMYNTNQPYLLFEVYDDNYKEMGNAVARVTQRFEPSDKGVFIGLDYMGCSDDHYRWYIESSEAEGGLPKKTVHHLCRDDAKKCKVTLKNNFVIHCRRWAPVPREAASAALQEWGYAGLPQVAGRRDDDPGDGLGLKNLPPRGDGRPPLPRRRGAADAAEDDDEDFEEDGEEERGSSPPKRPAARTRKAALKAAPVKHTSALDAMLDGGVPARAPEGLVNKLDTLREKLKMKSRTGGSTSSKPGGILAKRALHEAGKKKGKKRKRRGDVMGELKKALTKKKRSRSEGSGGSHDDSSYEEEDEDDEEKGDASGGWQSKRKRFKNIAVREPGRLMVEALESMQEQLGSHFGDEYLEGDRLQPMVTRYLLSVVVPTMGAQHIPRHFMRELRTIAMATDLLLKGRSDSAGDALLQRFKSVCMQIRDGSEKLGPQLELLPDDVFGTGATSEDATFAREIAYKEARSNELMRKTGKTPG